MHCALIPTYTERYEVLRATVAALAEQSYPDQQRVCAIITRVTDSAAGRTWPGCARSSATASAPSSTSRTRCCPAIVVGKSAAMAYGGPVLKQACDEMGLDPSRTVVTDLDSDFRLHPQYFAYITHEFCTADDRADLDLAAGAGVPQQPLARARGGACDGRPRPPSGRCSSTRTRTAW